MYLKVSKECSFHTKFIKQAFVYFNEKLHCCHGHRHYITSLRQMCYVTYGHNIIYDMLSTE